MTEKKPTKAIYIHRSTTAARPATKQQQAAEAWAAAEKPGHKVVEVDGTPLGDEPPRP